MKQCSCCKLLKEETEYYRNPKTKDGLQHYCKDCERETQRARRLAKGMKPRSHTPKSHKCSYRFGFCVKCRNARRWKEYNRYGHPVICKSGRVAPQASFA